MASSACVQSVYITEYSPFSRSTLDAAGAQCYESIDKEGRRDMVCRATDERRSAVIGAM